MQCVIDDQTDKKALLPVRDWEKSDAVEPPSQDVNQDRNQEHQQDQLDEPGPVEVCARIEAEKRKHMGPE